MNRLITQKDADAVNSPAFEVVARNMYGLIKAFGECRRGADWRAPKGVSSKTWRAKVRWGLLD
eukprot:3929935-Lingulodinium_polyedra.AAC.1